MTMRSWWIPLAACLALVGMQSDVRAYCLSLAQGKTYKWESSPVTYFVSKTADAKTIAAIDAAFAAWAAVKCSNLSFKYGGTFTQCTTKTSTACTSGKHFYHADQYIRIFWVTSKAAWPYDDDKSTATQIKAVYASYYFTWFGMKQNLTGASIAINAFSSAAKNPIKWSTTGASGTLDVQGELTALIGGVIGIGESKVKGATMYPGMAYADTSKRTLGKDDVAAISYLYHKSTCTKPPTPTVNSKDSFGNPVLCNSGGTTTKDGGTTTKDGGTTTKDGAATGDTGGTNNDSGVNPGSDAYINPGTDGGSNKQCTSSAQCADGEFCTAEGTCMGAGEDDGCCRVSHARKSTSLPYLALLGLAILLGLTRRRRRR